MLKFYQLCIILFFVLLNLLSGKNVLASHAMGGDIYYECLNPSTNTYRITFAFYRDCAGIGAPSSVNITYNSSCGGGSVTGYQLGSGVEVTPLCPAQLNMSRCNGGSLPGVQRYVYQATISNLAPCANWVFGVGINARNGAITTGPSGTLFVQSTLNNIAAPCNSSPQFTSIPVPYVCINNTIQYNQGATDPDGDSLAYVLVQPRTGTGSFVNFNFPYSAVNPISSSTGFNFNPLNGNLSFTPNLIQVGVLAIEVREYRNGVLIGSTIRDIQITVINCTNQSPNILGISNVAGGDSIDAFTARVCPNSNLTFNITATDPDNHVMVQTSNVSSQLSGATLTQNGPGTTINSTFSWTPTTADKGSHTFVLNLADNGCPISAISARAFTIIVDSIMDAGPDTAILCDQPVQLLAIGGDTFSWSPSLGLNNPYIPNPTATNTVPTMYTVVSNCGVDSVFVDVIGPSHTVDAGPDDTICRGSTVSLNASVSPPSASYTYAWTPATTINAPTVINPAATPVNTTDYVLTVSDGPCIVSDTTRIVTTSAQFSISSQISNVSCNGGSNGTLNITVSGGNPPYQFSLNGGSPQGNGIFNNLQAGSYNIQITDNLQCDSTITLSITEPAVLSISLANSDSASCNGYTDGSLIVSATGGASPYLYNIVGGSAQVSDTFLNLGAGSYNLRVTDSNGCFDNLIAQVFEPNALVLNSAQVDSVSCNGGNNGQIQVSALGGITPYSYSFNSSPFTAQNTFPNLSQGSYQILCLDYNGCLDSQVVAVHEPLPLNLTLNTDSVNCFGASDGIIFSFAGGGTGPYSFSIDGLNFQYSNAFQNLPIGRFGITVRDNNNCTLSDSASIYQPVPLNLTLDTVVMASCFGYSDGWVRGTTSGGTGSYLYWIDQGLQQTSRSFSGLAQGTYSLKVQDLNQCTDSISVSVNEPSQLNVQVTQVDSANCNGSADGSVTLSASGATPGYSFSINSQAFVSNPSFSGLTAGFYQFVARDSNQCLDSTSAIVLEPSAIVPAFASVDSTSCFTYSDGSITGMASGGTGSFSFSIDSTNYQSSPLFLNQPAGPITLYVRDFNQCVVSTDTVIPQPGGVNATLTIDSVNCFNGQDGSIIVNAGGGTSPYTYSIGAAFQISDSFLNLQAGYYSVMVLDQNNCTLTIADDVYEPAEMQIWVDSVQNISCYLGSDAFIATQASGGTGVYTFTNNSGAGQSNGFFTNLNQGSYNVVVTDIYGCADSLNQSISEPTALNLQVSQIDSASCFGFADGQVILNANGATPPYSYQINNQAFVSSPVFSGLAAGTYQFIVRDTNQCLDTTSAIVYEPVALTLSYASVDSVSCFGYSDGSVIGLGSGGTGVLNFSLDGANFQTSSTFANLPAGPITLYIRDYNQCLATLDTTVPQPSGVTASLTIDSVNCFSGQDGSIDVNANGGTPPYTYSIGGAYQSSASFQNLNAGAYTVNVLDQNNCLLTLTTDVFEPALLQISVDTFQNVSCYQGSDAFIQVQATGGSGIYNFSNNGGSSQTSNLFSNLSQGSYQILVTDYHGCADSVTQQITEPLALQFSIAQLDSISCHDANDGMVQLISSGGTPAYQYSLNGGTFQSNPQFSNISDGSYTVVLEDDNGCQDQLNFTLFNPLALLPTVVDFEDISCFGYSDGSIQVNPTNGFAPFSYSLDGLTYQSADSFLNLTAGAYILYVRDRKNCEESINHNLNQPSQIQLGLIGTNITCFGFDDGQIEAIGSGSVPPYRFSLNGDSLRSNNIYTDLAPSNNYLVQVVDTNGCETDATIAITEPDTLIGSVVATDVTCYLGNDGTLTMSAVGGTTPYRFDQSLDQIIWGTNNSGYFSNLPAGQYSLRIVDANGCINEYNSEIIQPERSIINAFTDSTTCFDYRDGQAGFIASSPSNPEKSPFSFSIDGIEFYPETHVFTSLAGGNYWVYSRDSEACIDSIPFFVPQPPEQLVRIKPSPVFLELGDSVQVFTAIEGRPNRATVQYDWFPRYGLSCYDCPDPIVQSVYSTGYTLTVTEIGYGCETITGLDVTVGPPDPVFVPNIFTPNGDGFNDHVYVFGNNLEQIEFLIFDRWGEKVFETEDQTIGWDGVYKGVNARPGVYTWSLKGLYINGHRFSESGTVTLYR